MSARTIVNPATNSALSSSVIRNELQLLENEISAIGTPVKELFPVSSATTTITLTHTPQNIVSLSYNGEIIYQGQAWTISGTIVTLTFTPENGTYIEAIYSY